jgi:hypothetical protein
VPEERLELSRGYPHRILSPRNHILNGIEQCLLLVFPMDFLAGVCASVPLSSGGLGTITGTFQRPKNLAGLLRPEFHSAYWVFLSVVDCL